MAAADKILLEMQAAPTNVRFADLARICELFFGKPRQSGSSHRVYKTSWMGDPRVNIQNDKGKAKAYQVKQVLVAIEKMQSLSTKH
jgi:hypothetical protein